MTPRQKKRASLAADLSKWFSYSARDLPWRRTRDPYAIWISEIMLQQTQVKTVVPYFDRWMRALPSVGDFARARPERVLKLWEGLGYYRRARNAHAAARQIVQQHGGIFPRDFDAVLALPGIGRYTAGAICSIAFEQRVPILDGNVIRILSRLFGVSGNPRDTRVKARLWELSASLVELPATAPSRLNQALMELGALVCLPRRPNCEDCPVRRQCYAHREERVAEFPEKPERAAPTSLHFIAYVVRRGGKFLVRRRPAGSVNAGLWEFPNSPSTSLDSCFTTVGNAPIVRLRHSITRYRIVVEAFAARLSPRRCPDGTWKTIADLNKLPFTSAHRKIANMVIQNTT